MRSFLFVAALICCLWSGDSFSETPNPSSQSRRVIVMLEGIPVSGAAIQAKGPSPYKGSRGNLTRAKQLTDHRAALEREQDGFIRRLQSLSPDIRIQRRFTGLINAVAVEIPQNLESQIHSWPEVLAVVPSHRYRPLLNESNPLMGSPQAWQSLGGEETAGRGMKIGVIDTGIDHTHMMFDDTGYEYPDGFPLGETEFTNKKVIVARSFPEGAETELEASPRDLDGHGTHSASCAAGRLNTPSPLGLISGVAPNAYVGNYKVFTSEFAYSDQILAGLEACVEDGMDIINMSLGDEIYVETPFDPESLAIRNAIASGVVVVAAAGNSGTEESIGSPGQIPEVITVGSVSNAHAGYGPSNRTAASLNVYADSQRLLSGVEVVLGEDVDHFSRPVAGRFEIIDADAIDGGAYGGESDGAVCEDLPPDSTDGKWVLVQRYECTFSSKINRVEAAGGWGALIYNSANPDAGDPNRPVQLPSAPGTKIPAFFVGRSVGLEIKQAIHDHGRVDVEFVAPAPSVQSQEPYVISSFSSVGPTVDYGVKPDLVSVGGGSYAAVQNDVPDGGPSGNRFQLSGFDFISGTSFSTPRVAGAAALVMQAHPDWTPEQIKSALVSAAERPDTISDLSPMIRGGGFARIDKAIDVPVVVSPPTLSFQRQMLGERTTAQRALTVKNVSKTTDEISLVVEFGGRDSLVSGSITPGEMAIAPNEQKTAILTLTVDPPSGAYQQPEIDGDVVITVDGVDNPLRVPFWARTILAPQPVGTVLLLDDDDDQES
ncbi:MAG: S8 family serine peptidase, partial [bacterium]